MPPGPERRRVIGSPFAADEELLDRDAEQDQTDFREQQSNDRAGDRVSTPERNRQTYRIVKMSPSSDAAGCRC